MTMKVVDDKIDILRSLAEQVTAEDHEFHKLFQHSPQPLCLQSLPPSDQNDIAQVLMKIMSVNKLVSAGCKAKIVISDYIAQWDSKFGGDTERIRDVCLYMIEVLKAAGLNVEGGQVEIIWSSQKINSKPDEYWPLAMDIARHFQIREVMSCVESMGLYKEKDEMPVAYLLDICMQCADIFFTKADICHMSMDQQAVNLLAREFCDANRREKKPIILSHHMVPSLQQGIKRPKSELSCIFAEDDEGEVQKKIKKAFCPIKEVKGNPLIDFIKFIIFPWFGEIRVEECDGDGEKIFESIEDLVSDYEKELLHPNDLKVALIKAINKILQPIRDHFQNDPTAKELLERVKKPVKTKSLNFPQTPKDKKLFTNLASSSSMSFDEKLQTVRSVAEEIILDKDLLNLLKHKPEPICYNGFEPSGRMHIAQGVMKMINVNKLTSADCKMKIWIADWFAQLNNKMGGDLEKIRIVGKYMIEIWKAVGLNMQGDKVEFLWASQEINSRAEEYWSIVMDIARRNTVTRIKRCVQIMGRREEDELTVAQLLYPCMQCADIFFLKADICQLGMDQRKVNVLAREFCSSIGRKEKPVILSHHMLPGLKQGQEKMSKSDTSSSIFMEDEEETVIKKIADAHCPEMLIEGNPCLEYIKYLIFPRFGNFSVVDRGGEKTFSSFEELSADYKSGKLLPDHLKPALSKALNKILQPVRDHFEQDIDAKRLLERVKDFRITR